MAEESGITVAELARHLGGELRGDGARVVRTVATLEQAGPEAVSWVGDQRHLRQLEQTRAGAVLIGRDIEPPAGRTVIRVADPDLALCDVLRVIGPSPERVPPGVHPSAVIGAGAVVEGAAIGPHVTIGARARIGAGTQLHAGVYVGADTRIGRDCVLWPNVVVRERTAVGDRVMIHSNTTIGTDGFGYLQRGGRHHKIPQVGRVVIEDDVEIGANAAIDRARSGETRIRRGTKIDNLVQIAHNCDIGEDCIIVGQCGISGSVTLGHHVLLSGHVGVIDHVRIADGVTVAATSIVFGDLAGGRTYRGSPAVEKMVFGRQQVSLQRLPKALAELRALTKRVEQLESAANHPETG